MADHEDPQATIRRLEVRLDRERRARAEAEQIAEAGLRSLYDSNQELDRRILERTTELHRALEVAESANSAKSLFLGQMSHQINTPLNGLLGMLELLGTEVNDDQAREWHASAMRSARRLERLTTRLITYVELEAVGDLDDRSQPVSVRDLLGAIYDRWHLTCMRAGQLLAVEVLPGTDAAVPHSVEVDLMFDELMSNVVSHAGPGAVTIRVGRGESPNEVRFEVSDPGPGVDPQTIAGAHHLNGLPGQTQRGDAPVNLGMALIDRIVGALGGSWMPMDGPGTSTVVVVVPTARPASPR